MPAGLKRYQGPRQTHFLTFSCYCRKPYLAEPAARDLFVETLRSTSQRYEFEVIGYVVMPEHVHLLLNTPREYDLATAIMALKVSVSKRSVQRPFWQSRYYDFNVLTIGKLNEKLNYMHNNPVVRGLVPLPELWTWSSCSFPIVT